MPPKPAPGKKGKEDLEDYTDVVTLPTLNSITTSVLPRSFFSQQSREAVQKAIQEKFVTDHRIKTITREELIAYAKLRQIILEPNVAATLPQDDPRHKMTEADQLAKATCDKLFELSVAVRRLKKEKHLKLEEEYKLQQQQDPSLHGKPLILEEDQLDTIFNLVDYPNTKAEALALAKYNLTVNLVLDISQVMKPADADGDDEQQATQELPPSDGFPDQEHFDKLTGRLNNLIDARVSSVINSPLRYMMIEPIKYVKMPRHISKLDEHGQEEVQLKDAETGLIEDLVKRLEYIGVVLLKYRKFREKVHLIPLIPDKDAIQGLDQLKQDSESYHQWLQDNEHALTLSQSQRELLQEDQIKEREQRKQEFESQRTVAAQMEEERKTQMAELRKKLKVSKDDTKDYSKFNLDLYNANFIKNNESKNSIQAIMTGMVAQISQGQDNFDAGFINQQDAEQSTEPESIDDLFDSFKQSVEQDINYNHNLDVEEDQNDFSSLGPRNKRPGTEAFATQTSLGGDIEYHEELDKSKVGIFRTHKLADFNDFDKAEDECLLEKNVLENLVLPGVNRNLMPQVPSKSERLRNSEKPQMYPFCTLPIEDAERAMILRAFQELLKSNGIDEGQQNNQKQPSYQVFSRNFETHMKPEILRQVLAEAFLKEPDVATLYYPRTDALLIAIYNKIKGDTDNPQAPQGQRDWKAAYRSMPDFENWVRFFAEEILVPSQGTHGINTTGKDQPRLQFDDEMIPEQMLQIDDQKIQNISEHSEMFYPGDGSIMKVDTYNVGGNTYKKSVVYKDNLVFGLRKANQDVQVPPEEEKEYGLQSTTRVGEHEFWMSFDNDIKLLVEQVQYVENPQRLIRIDPPKPTPEEIAAREEAIKLAQIAAAKNKGKSALANIPVIEEYKEPEPTWEPEPKDFFDTYFTETFLNWYAPFIQSTTSFPNGLIVKHMGDGTVVQMTEDQIFNKGLEEKDRVIFNNSGAVIRHFINRDAELLFPNGVTATFNKQEMAWTITNNKGLRTVKKGGITWDIDPIPCATETDAVTNAVTMIREDKVLTIQFKDNSVYCQHADGTLMLTSADKKQIRIEKDGYAPVVIFIGDCLGIRDDLKKTTAAKRSINGFIMETYLPDGTVVESFQDYIDYSPYFRHVYNRKDFTVVSVGGTGQVDVVSSNTRSTLNDVFEKRAMGQDTAFGNSLFNGQDSYFVRGVYHAKIMGDQPQIFSINKDSQYFYTIDKDFNLVAQSTSVYTLSDQFNQQVISQLASSPYQQPSDGEEINADLEDVGGYINPTEKDYMYPRLFVINNDNTGYEVMSKEQLEYYFRIAKNRPESMKQRRNVMVGGTLAKSHYFITKVKNMEDTEIEYQQLRRLSFPQNAQYALLHVKNAQKYSKLDRNLGRDQFIFRQIFEFQDFESIKQESFYDDFNRFRQWKMSQVRYENEFSIVFVPAKDQVLDQKKIDDDEYQSRRISTKILKERRTGRKKFVPDEFKKDFIQSTQNNEKITLLQRRLTLDFSERQGSIIGVQPDPANDRVSAQQQIHETINMEKYRLVKKKQEQYVQQQLQEIRRMINTPTFLPAYFQSKEGQLFTKNHPQKPPSQEMIMRMSQRINRSQKGGDTEKGNSNYEGNQSRHDGDNQSPALIQDQPIGNNDEKESPIVALEPEDNFKNPLNMNTKKSQLKQSNLQASLYLQEKIYLKQKDQETVLKAEEYHVVKTKDFNVIGRLRPEKPYVKAIQKSTAQSELNEKFITTECIADRRVKISSMAPRQYINAPSIEDVRKQGQHQMILSAINKKQTFAELINQANSMVTSVLHDPLKRSLNVMPSQIKFGIIQTGGPGFELILTLKNEDQIAQRVTIKPLNDKRIQVQQLDTGPIATGMTRKISVTILAHEECKIKDILQIVTKTDIFKVPIEAQVLSPENYQKELQEQRALNGRSLTNSKVRSKLNDQIQKGRMSAHGERIIEEGDEGGDHRHGGDYFQTTQSDSKLPAIPQADKRPFEVDPKKNLKDLLKK